MCVTVPSYISRVLHAFLLVIHVYLHADHSLHIGFVFRDVEGQSTRHANQIWAKYDVGHEWVTPCILPL
jgi:hypothetical protein